MPAKITVHMVANNHIDREWTYDNQLTRMITVKFFEDLVETFETIPDFQFVLDSQTVPLEDYLEISPERRDTLSEYISNGRLWVGPWYTAPDSFYLNGESLVRNLLIGHRLAASFGGVSKFGYTPFGWGQISQLPQIYHGFGIDSVFFYRGADTIEDNYYNWIGADGTVVNCLKFGRTNFFDKIFRPMTKNRDSVPWDRELDYCDNGVPFMFSMDESKYEHGFMVEDKFHVKSGATIRMAIDDFVDSEKSSFPGNIVLGMNGMDTCFPPLKGLLAIDEIKKAGSEQYEMIYSSLDAFSNELKKAVAETSTQLHQHTGEMRRFLAGFGGKGKSEAKSTHFYLAAARPKQKSKNTKAENLLTRYAEPFSAIAYVLGAKYPSAYLTTAWKYVLKCHPHDTIAGCGADQIQIDMLNRLDQAINISNGLLNFSAQHIVKNIDNSDIRDDEIALVIFNPSPFVRREVVQMWLHIPEQFDYGVFDIYDKTTRSPMNFTIMQRGEKEDRIFRDLTDTSLYAYGELVKIAIDVNVSALGYKTLVVCKADGKQASDESQSNLAADMEMQNEYIKVALNHDGTFHLMNKETGMYYSNLHYFTDTGDNGDPWVRFVPDKNRIVSTKGTRASVKLIENSPLRSSFEITYNFMIPTGLLKEDYNMEGYYNKTRSSDELIPLPIKSIISITKHSRYADIYTEIDNNSHDHLIQVNFPTTLASNKVYAESGFDVVERVIKKNIDDTDPSLVNGEDPFLRFLDVTDGTNGLSILSDSIKGYEPLGDKDNTIALNLIRSYTSQIVTIYGRKERRPDFELTQAQGKHCFHYAIFPHEGEWTTGCVEQAECVNYPMVPTQTHRSFGQLPSSMSFVEISNKMLALSAIKKAEDSDILIIRLYNPSPKAADGELVFFREIKYAYSTNLNEEPIEVSQEVKHTDNKLYVSVEAKKIATYAVQFK